MASLNQKRTSISGTTAEGAPARKQSVHQELERSVMACLLWENNFYESGELIGQRIARLVAQADPQFVADLAVRSRTDMKIRHVGLHLIRELVRRPEGRKHAAVLAQICQRPDDMTEFMSLYWADGKCPIASGVKRALGEAFQKFSEYQLAKYDRQGKAVRLQDVLFLIHGKPRTTGEHRYNAQDRKLSPRPIEALTEHEKLYLNLIEGNMASPETWENRLSRGEDAKTVWTEMLQNRELGALAFIRNFRNMDKVGVSKDLIREYSKTVKVERLLPFQFITAARVNPMYEDILEAMMFRCLEGLPKRKGTTKVLIDVSGSMGAQLSQKGETLRIDVACGLAVLARELYEDVEIYSFSNNVVQVAPRRGFALRDAILQSQPHGGTYLGAAVEAITKTPSSRVIVLTDEQSHDAVRTAKNTKAAYMINVASDKRTVAYGPWVSLTGWSEHILTYIDRLENAE